MSLKNLLIGLTGSILIPISAMAGSADRETKVIDAFLQSIAKNDSIDADVRDRLTKSVTSLRDDEYSWTLAITEGLREIYPEFRAALESMGGEDLTPAITALSRLKEADDPFLASDAMFYLAQAYTFVERYEDAIPVLIDLIGQKSDTSVQTGDATFLLGVSQARTLKREEAIESLTRFLKDNPNAPERMRIGAWRQREQLVMLQEGTMADVYDRMDYSRRRLQLEDAGKQTQQEQEQIITMLAKLIKEAEERECNCAGGGQQGQQGKGDDGEQGQGKGNKGGNSQNENGVVRRTYRQGPESPWSKLRDRQRDPAFSALKEKFPARYQQLIEQYYKSFQGAGGE